MLLYPVAYTIIILPIAVARFTGGDVPFGVTIFCDTIYLLSGAVNAILFTATRRILPPKSIIPGRFVISHPKLLASSLEEGSVSYLPSEDEKSPISILKGGGSYRSDASHSNSTKSDLPLPPEYLQEPVRPLEIRRPHFPQASNHAVRESGESTFDLYTYRKSEFPRITEQEFRQSEAIRNSGRPGFSDVRLDE